MSVENLTFDAVINTWLDGHLLRTKIMQNNVDIELHKNFIHQIIIMISYY